MLWRLLLLEQMVRIRENINMKNIFTALILASVLLTGCGQSTTYKPLEQVKGKVLLPKGKPLEGGRIMLKRKDGKANPFLAEINKDGTFKVDNEIILEGDYEIYLVFKRTTAERKYIKYVPTKYREIGEGDSDISVTLTEDNQDIVIKLKA